MIVFWSVSGLLHVPKQEDVESAEGFVVYATCMRPTSMVDAAQDSCNRVPGFDVHHTGVEENTLGPNIESGWCCVSLTRGAQRRGAV